MAVVSANREVGIQYSLLYRAKLGCAPEEDDLSSFKAQMTGPTETPYEGGLFELRLKIGDRYPFEPPKVRFLTPLYHPNVDQAGRICLDLLKMPPSGSWKPALNLSSLLTSLRVLLGEANPDDGLIPEISVRVQFSTLLNLQVLI